MRPLTVAILVLLMLGGAIGVRYGLYWTGIIPDPLQELKQASTLRVANATLPGLTTGTYTISDPVKVKEALSALRVEDRSSRRRFRAFTRAGNRPSATIEFIMPDGRQSIPVSMWSQTEMSGPDGRQVEIDRKFWDKICSLAREQQRTGNSRR